MSGAELAWRLLGGVIVLFTVAAVYRAFGVSLPTVGITKGLLLVTVPTAAVAAWLLRSP